MINIKQQTHIVLKHFKIFREIFFTEDRTMVIFCFSLILTHIFKHWHKSHILIPLTNPEFIFKYLLSFVTNLDGVVLDCTNLFHSSCSLVFGLKKKYDYIFYLQRNIDIKIFSLLQFSVMTRLICISLHCTIQQRWSSWFLLNVEKRHFNTNNCLQGMCLYSCVEKSSRKLNSSVLLFQESWPKLENWSNIVTPFVTAMASWINQFLNIVLKGFQDTGFEHLYTSMV